MSKVHNLNATQSTKPIKATANILLHGDGEIPGVCFVDYRDESQLDDVMSLVGRDLSEPYSIFTYRYFLHRFPELCILAVSEDAPDEPIGCVVGKVDDEERLYVAGGASDTTSTSKVGYLGMLAVGQSYRRRGIGKELVRKILQRMKDMGCDSVILETEVTNRTAQQLYQDCFGFVREELLVRYYLNWNDAYRLRLWFV
jgi:peptide alpha-N-acetyltransferase